MKIPIKLLIRKILINNTIVILFALLISGCAGPMVSKLQKAPRIGDKFSIALTNEYQSFAEYEMNEMMDEVDALYFAQKGFLSSQGKHVEPELLENWKIPESKLTFLKNARKELVQVLPESKIKVPILSAKAQSAFDCWVEQQEENWQWNHIDKCRKKFRTSINKIYNILNPIEIKDDQKAIAPSEIDRNTKDQSGESETDPANKTKKQNTREKIQVTYRVYFEFDSYKLTKENLKNIADIFKLYSSGSYINVTVEGHTDSSGSNEYNSTLSLKRAESVKNAFLKLGINNNEISILSFGESKLLVATQDGVREAKNRRAKVIISE